MSFTFNKPPTPSGQSSNMFGGASNNNTSAPGTNPTGSAPKFSFGQPATTSASQPSPFGGATTGGAFGGASGTPFSFGKKPEGNTSSEAPKSLFTGFGAASTQSPATPGSTAPSLFGATTPVTTAAPTWSFGNPSTTPAGPPPAANAFGASTGGSSLFGNPQPQQTTSTQEGSKQPAFSFLKPAATPATTAAGSAQPATTTSVFGAAPAATNSIFGSKPADSASGVPASTLFGAKPVGSSTAGNMFGSKPAEATPGGGIFGSKPAATTPAGGNLFGTSPSNPPATTNIFGPKPGDKPADDKSTTSPAEPAKPTFSFGAPANTTPSTAAPSPFFKAPAAIASNPSAIQSGQPTPSLFGTAPAAPASGTTPSLFAKPATTSATGQTAPPAFSFPTSSQPATTSASTTTTAAPAQKPLFGALPASLSSTSAPLFAATSTPATTTQTAAATTAPAPSPSLFGAANPTPATQPTTSATAPAAPTGFSATTSGAANLGTSTATLSGLGASTSGPLPPAQSRLKNKTMDEILTRWATDLSRYTKDFKSHAETIAQWDQIIVDNSSKIDKLYIKTRTCEKQTMSVEMQLAAVENQQNELESWLSKYENDVEDMLARGGANSNEPGGPDQERERTYKMAEKLGEQLNDMGRDLESMVEEVNAANSSLSKHTKSDEPITQIVRILNSHLTQLQTIDVGTAALQNKVLAAQKSAGSMGYMNGGAHNDGHAAVDDFYRSYMGRR